jgi:hypothetical protein
MKYRGITHGDGRLINSHIYCGAMDGQSGSAPLADAAFFDNQQETKP